MEKYVSIIVTVVIAIGILVFLYFRKRNDEAGKEEIKKFLDTLQSDFEAVIMEAIEKFDFISFDNLILAEQHIINSVIDVLWSKAIRALEDYVTDPLSKLVIKKYLTRENIESFIREIFRESVSVQTKYTSKYNTAILAANKDALSFEKETEDFNEEIDKDVPVDFVEVEYIDPTSIIDKEGNVVQQELNPPKEEESEEIDTNDSSIEILE